MSTQPSLFNRFFPQGFQLETTRVLIRPLEKEDLDPFLALSQDRETWKFFYADLHEEQNMREWIDKALEEQRQERRMPLTIIDKDTKEICGSTSFGNISWYDRRIEIGWTWLGAGYRGMGVNKNVKFALISYAFQVMQMERVEAKTDVLSEQARGGLLKAGMVPEGILRSHTQMHSGRRRDTIYFSVLRGEWAERRASFYPEML